MKIHVQCNNKVKKVNWNVLIGFTCCMQDCLLNALQKKPYKVRKVRYQDRKKSKSLARGYTDAEAALSRATTAHQVKQLR